MSNGSFESSNDKIEINTHIFLKIHDKSRENLTSRRRPSLSVTREMREVAATIPHVIAA